jgi:peroxiredoxin
MCHLQELYRQYQDKGLVVLGFNCADDKQIALGMLHDNGVTFPNVIDSSDAALKVCFQQYQQRGSAAVPLSYVIDREGKVVNAWYGYEKGHPKVKAFLEKMEIKEAPAGQ